MTMEQLERRDKAENEYRQKLIDSLGMTLFVTPEFLITTEENIKKLVAQGASVLLNQITDNELKVKTLSLNGLKNKGSIDLHAFYM